MTYVRHANEFKIILGAFFISGVSALIYEVTWARTLSLILGSTVYAISTMLSTFMGGLALGSYIGGKISDRTENHLLYFSLCEVGIGIMGITSIPLIFALPGAYLYLYQHFHFYPAYFFTLQILLCSAVMLIPTSLMGATFPLVSKKITQNFTEMGRSVGTAYSVNTIGAVIGSLMVGFLLIPQLGIKGATFFAAALNLLTSFVVMFHTKLKVKKALFIIIPTFALVAVWTSNARLETTMANFYNLHRALDGKGIEDIAEIESIAFDEISHEEWPQGTVRALKEKGGSLVLQVGGKIEGTSNVDIPNTILLAYIPIASHIKPINFLNIGLGAGITLAAAKEQLHNIDLVEINPGVVRAVDKYGKSGLLDGIRIIINDARNYLVTAEKKYDVISSEPSYPTEFEVASLFTKDFFEIASKKLNKNGVYCQWMPYYIFTNEDVFVMVKTFSLVFPHAVLWKIPQSRDLILIGSNEPFAFTPDEVKARVEEMNKGRYFLKYVLSRNSDEIAALAMRPDIPVNTDDRPILEFSAVNNLLMGDLTEKNKETYVRYNK